MSEAEEITTLDQSPAHSLMSTDENANNGTRTEVGSKTANVAFPAVRRRLPDERQSLTHHFSIGGQEGYVTVGLYEDGLPGQMFIRMAKEGSTVSGLMDSFATAVSLGLQYGVPL
jgi:ribonucleoside-diphosphate reductase alpha chain